MITALVVSYESAAVLPACVMALREDGANVLVVDNASQDESVNIARSYGAECLLLPHNTGYGRANNQGAKAAVAADYILICNPDLVLEKGSILQMVSALEAYAGAGIIGLRLVEPDGRVFFPLQSLLSPYLKNPRRIKSLPEGDCCVPFVSGACFLMRRSLFLELGGFDENIFLFYEDDDLCRRVIDAGYSLIYVHQAIAKHVRGGSSRSETGRIYQSRWHQAWSKAYVSHKYGLPNPVFKLIFVNGLKAFLSLMVLNSRRYERYAGSVAGAWAFLRGRKP